MRIELLHQVLLHVPLNLVWRLVGLSRNLNKLLLLEQFWKEKCQEEFSLLHTKIASYRRYYLIRSERIVGNLYSRQGTIIQSRVKWYQEIYLSEIDQEYLLYHSEDKIYYDQTMIVGGVKTISAINDLEHFYLLMLNDGRRRFLRIFDNSDWECEGNWMGPDHDRTMIQATEIKNNGHKSYWLLLASGRLYYTMEKEIKQYSDNVVSICSVGNRELFIIDQDGKCNRINILRDGSIKTTQFGDQNYIRWSNCLTADIGYKNDRTEIFTIDHDHPNQIVTNTVPIRSILYEDWESIDRYEFNGIAVGIDGVGHLHNSSILIARKQEINYFGLIEIGQDEYILAVRKLISTSRCAAPLKQ